MIAIVMACLVELVQSNASSIIKIVGMTRGRKMNTTKKIKLLQELLERRYPQDIYDISAKNSIFRLHADKIINKLYQLEEVNNHE